MRSILFEVNTLPVAQPRQRHRIVERKRGKSFVQNYTPKSAPVNNFKKCVQDACKKVFHGKPVECPLRINLLCIFPRPSNKVWKTRPMPPYPKLSKPDKDNLEKSVFDALNGILYKDDSQIISGDTIKIIGRGSDEPRIIVRVGFYETEDDFNNLVDHLINYFKY